MRCRMIRQWIVEFATDGVDPARRAAFDAHLAGCRRCAAEWQAVGEVSPLLAAVSPPVADEAVLASIRGGVAAALDAEPTRPAPRRFSLAALAAATCLFAGLWIGFHGPTSEESPGAAPQAEVADQAAPAAAPAPAAPPAAARVLEAPAAPAPTRAAAAKAAPPAGGQRPKPLAKAVAPRARPSRPAAARPARPGPRRARRSVGPRREFARATAGGGQPRLARRTTVPAQPAAPGRPPLPATPPPLLAEASPTAAASRRAGLPAWAGADEVPTDAPVVLMAPVVSAAASERFVLRAEEPAAAAAEREARRTRRPLEAASAAFAIEPAVIESRVVPTLATRVVVP